MASMEKLPAPIPEEPEQPKKKLALRIAARPVSEVLSGKQKIIPYEEPEVFEPPIVMPIYEEFDAAKSFADLKAEIAAMRDLPPDVRRGRIRARIGEIRERLARQREGIAKAITEFREAIQQNPDEDDRDLFRRVAELAPTYHFSGDELREFWNAIVGYRMQHRLVERYRNEYPDDAAFFEACFGQKPKGKVEVKKGPMSLYFRCDNDEDYIRAFSVAETGGDEKKLTEDLRTRALATGGIRMLRLQIPELDNVVAAGRVSANPRQRAYDEVIRAHEEQHIANKLFIPAASRLKEAEVMARVARTATDVDEGRRMLMQELARSARKTMSVDNAARDEMLAFYQSGASPAEILRNLFTTKLYDYRNNPSYKPRIDNLPKVIAGKMMNEMSAVLYAIDAQGKEKVRAAGPLITHYSEVAPYVEKAFGEEYKKDIARWIGALETLGRKGYTRDEVVAMLYGERVADWTAFARRAPERKF